MDEDAVLVANGGGLRRRSWWLEVEVSGGGGCDRRWELEEWRR